MALENLIIVDAVANGNGGVRVVEVYCPCTIR